MTTMPTGRVAMTRTAFRYVERATGRPGLMFDVGTIPPIDRGPVIVGCLDVLHLAAEMTARRREVPVIDVLGALWDEMEEQRPAEVPASTVAALRDASFAMGSGAFPQVAVNPISLLVSVAVAAAIVTQLADLLGVDVLNILDKLRDGFDVAASSDPGSARP